MELALLDQDEILVGTERIQSVFQQAPVTLGVTVVNAILTTVVLGPVSSRTLLSIWLALVVTVSVVRMVVRQSFLRRVPKGVQTRRWAVLTVIGSLTTGILWGVGAAVLCPAVETYQLFFSFVIGGMCAGTTTVNSAHLPSVLAFILPATLPLAASFLTDGSALRLVSALMILVFAAALSLTSLRAHRAFGERIQLQLTLSRQGRELADANERLRGEITQRQNAEASLQQAQKMEAIGHLTSGIAHDFNNLMQVVTGNLSMIGRLADSNTQILRCVRRAEQGVEQGARLTSSLLAFGRRQLFRMERASLNTLIQEFRPILLRAIGNTIHFRTDLAPDLPSCNVDPTHFQSAILNLVINANDAMPEGGKLLISTGVTMLGTEDLLTNPDAGPGRFVSASVRDNGPGMTEETVARVFEPFFTTKEIGKGSGLGLSQVYGFARQSRGHVKLCSKPGAGTCVTLYLPAWGVTMASAAQTTDKS